jgi:predicted nucleotidyltransferase
MPKTAKDLTKREMLAYRPWLALEGYRVDPETRDKKDHAWKIAKGVAALLKQRYGATRVVAFGSIVRESGFTPWSDVDLAVWGLTPDDYFDAAGEAMDLGLDGSVKVEVVDMGKCPSALREAVDGEGVEL